MVKVTSFVNIALLEKKSTPQDGNHVHFDILLEKFVFLNLVFISLKLLKFF